MIGSRLLDALRHRRSRRVRAVAGQPARALCFGLFNASISAQQVALADPAQLSEPGPALSGRQNATAPSSIETPAVAPHRIQRANFEREPASHAARYVADWVVDSGDNGSLPFVIVDKTEAKVFVFDAHGRLGGAAPALLGLARSDDAVPGIGDRQLSSIRPGEKTTQAGRFVAALGGNMRGEDVLWVDYDTALSMHRVLTTNPKERRLQRLATATPLDNRVSFGCINIPAKFYENVVRPAFTGTNGIVYILPETRSARGVFGAYDVEAQARSLNDRKSIPAHVASEA